MGKIKEDSKNVIAAGYTSISIDKLVKADWNYKREDELKTEKLKNNIKRNGQIENIIIRELDTGYYEVVNGNHRFDALKALGFKDLMCFNLGKISLSQAQRIAIETNETKFDSDDVQLSKIIKDILQDFNIEDLVETMPYSENYLEDLAKLVDFDFDSLEDREGESNNESSDSDFIVIKIRVKTDDVDDFFNDIKDVLDEYDACKII